MDIWTDSDPPTEKRAWEKKIEPRPDLEIFWVHCYSLLSFCFWKKGTEHQSSPSSLPLSPSQCHVFNEARVPHKWRTQLANADRWLSGSFRSSSSPACLPAPPAAAAVRSARQQRRPPLHQQSELLFTSPNLWINNRASNLAPPPASRKFVLRSQVPSPRSNWQRKAVAQSGLLFLGYFSCVPLFS